jgi:phasin family protein
MFPFPQSVTPTARCHVDAQVSFMNDVSKSMFQSFQHMFDLNIQLAQTMLEETTTVTQQLATQTSPTEAISAVSARAQPTAEKLRAYQQHLSRVAADSQVELARVTEQHVQETTRTAKVLADEVQHVAAEETERSMRKQQETMRNFTDPFKDIGQQNGNGARGTQGNGADGGASTSKQTTTPAAAGGTTGRGAVIR